MLCTLKDLVLNAGWWRDIPAMHTDAEQIFFFLLTLLVINKQLKYFLGWHPCNTSTGHAICEYLVSARMSACYIEALVEPDALCRGISPDRWLRR